MANAESTEFSQPFPIFRLAGRYILYDVNTITYLRTKHNILGVLTGQLPQAPQQNVFSGIPLELMPEEVRLLCEKGVVYIVDDVESHKQGFLDRNLSDAERRAFRDSLRRQGQAAAVRAEEKSLGKKKAAFKRQPASGDWNDLPEDMLRPSSRASTRLKKGKKDRSVVGTPTGGTSRSATPQPDISRGMQNGNSKLTDDSHVDADESLFASSSHVPALGPPCPKPSQTEPRPWNVTPTVSYPPLTAPVPPGRSNATQKTQPSLELNDLHDTLEAAVPDLPTAPPSYPLFRHMHEQGYFQMPGIRFGCQYMAYPGDPLRFHSHFLCNGMDWDQEFDLLDLVGGGRLGTGVKKGFLVGGIEKKRSSGQDLEADVAGNGAGDGLQNVRAFCVEWAGM
jgi:tRNA-splicing endonuclease subunit Sen34